MPVPIHERIDADYGAGPVTPEALARVTELGEQTKALAHAFAELVPASRELSLALTGLQVALVWAQHGIVIDQARRGEPWRRWAALPVTDERQDGSLHRTSAQWRASKVVLGRHQWGVETDTGQRKQGDGIKGWLALDYRTMADGLPVRFATDKELDGVIEGDSNSDSGDGAVRFDEPPGSVCAYCGAAHPTSGHVELDRF